MSDYCAKTLMLTIQITLLKLKSAQKSNYTTELRCIKITISAETMVLRNHITVLITINL